MSDWNYVNTKASYYSGKGIKFLGIPAIDLKHYPLNLHFKGENKDMRKRKVLTQKIQVKKDFLRAGHKNMLQTNLD